MNILRDKDYEDTFLCCVSTKERDFYFRVSKSPEFFECDPGLWKMMKGKEEYIKNLIRISPSVYEFANAIDSYVRKMVDEKELCFVHRQLMDGIKAIGADHIESISNDLSTVVIKEADEEERVVTLTIDLVQKTVKSDLPIPLSVKFTTIQSVYESFKEQIPNFAEFWDEMDRIDQTFLVVRPENPSRSCAERLIMLKDDVFVRIEVSPIFPTKIPRISFEGSQNEIQRYETVFASNCRNWDSTMHITDNMMSVFDTVFPSKSTKIESFDCIICYDNVFTEKIDVCPSCHKYIHHSCLLKYFKTSREARHVLNVYSGPCPHCRSTIRIMQTNL